MMRALAALLCLAACASAPDPLAFAEPQASLPADDLPGEGVGAIPPAPEVNAICRDGWVSYSQHRRDACSGHGGVREWRNPPAN